MIKQFIKTDDNGKIISIVTSNDDTLVIDDGKNIIDITELKDNEKIRQNPDYFEIKNKKITELTIFEKKTVDDNKKIKFEPQENPLTEELQKNIK